MQPVRRSTRGSNIYSLRAIIRRGGRFLLAGRLRGGRLVDRESLRKRDSIESVGGVLSSFPALSQPSLSHKVFTKRVNHLPSYRETEAAHQGGRLGVGRRRPALRRDCIEAKNLCRAC